MEHGIGNMEYDAVTEGCGRWRRVVVEVVDVGSVSDVT